MKVYCVFSLESPHRGDSNVYTQYTIFILKKKITLIILNLQLWDFFQGTQERVWNSRGKRAISVQATEVLLYTKNVAPHHYHHHHTSIHKNNFGKTIQKRDNNKRIETPYPEVYL